MLMTPLSRADVDVQIVASNSRHGTHSAYFSKCFSNESRVFPPAASPGAVRHVQQELPHQEERVAGQTVSGARRRAEDGRQPAAAGESGGGEGLDGGGGR